MLMFASRLEQPVYRMYSCSTKIMCKRNKGLLLNHSRVPHRIKVSRVLNTSNPGLVLAFLFFPSYILPAE